MALSNLSACPHLNQYIESQYRSFFYLLAHNLQLSLSLSAHALGVKHAFVLVIR